MRGEISTRGEASSAMLEGVGLRLIWKHVQHCRTWKSAFVDSWVQSHRIWILREMMNRPPGKDSNLVSPNTRFASHMATTVGIDLSSGRICYPWDMNRVFVLYSIIRGSVGTFRTHHQSCLEHHQTGHEQPTSRLHEK